jgi:hypothetical protein
MTIFRSNYDRDSGMVADVYVEQLVVPCFVLGGGKGMDHGKT